jgi:two-component system chemotaxis response regulator CheB
MEAGAVACVEKPTGQHDPNYEATVQNLQQTVRLMAEVKVVRRWARLRHTPAKVLDEIVPSLPAAKGRVTPIKIVAIGASTGGPVALQTLLAALPRELPVPIVIVQHMATGFISGFADWLGQTTGLPTHVAADGESLLPGHVYVAPDGFQMRVRARGKIELTLDQAEYGLSPSVSYLFRSVAQVYGAQAVGILLTGMGRDGAADLKLMRDAGAITFAQDKESSVIHGMPGEAIRLEAALYVMPPERIASALVALLSHQAPQLSNGQARRNDARPEL